MTTDVALEGLWRQLAPQVLGALVRRYGDFGTAEDAVQEALFAAANQWPAEGLPDDPRAWLIRVASRKLIDQARSDRARHRREASVASLVPTDERVSAAADEPDVADREDTMTLLLLCCHPVLTPASQVALTLRAVGGLTTEQIARAFIVPETTMAQRISRAKQRIRETGARFCMPPEAERGDRMAAVLHVLYLIFNEGYTTTAGAELQSVQLTSEAVRLTREAHALVADGGEVTGLLALMLLTDARRRARTGADGALVPLDEQDRTAWDAELIGEGVALITDVLARGPVGPYQLQAAIAAVHAEAETAETTDWKQILALYALLEAVAPNPMVTLNRAVAAAMVHGPAAGLALLETLEGDQRMARHHRLHAVRAHVLELAGDRLAAQTSFTLAARLTTSLPEQRYLNARAQRLEGQG